MACQARCPETSRLPLGKRRPRASSCTLSANAAQTPSAVDRNGRAGAESPPIALLSNPDIYSVHKLSPCPRRPCRLSLSLWPGGSDAGYRSRVDLYATYSRPTPSPFTTSAGFSILTKWEINCKLGTGLIELPVVERFGHGGYAIALNCKYCQKRQPHLGRIAKT